METIVHKATGELTMEERFRPLFYLSIYIITPFLLYFSNRITFFMIGLTVAVSLPFIFAADRQWIGSFWRVPYGRALVFVFALFAAFGITFSIDPLLSARILVGKAIILAVGLAFVQMSSRTSAKGTLIAAVFGYCLTAGLMVFYPQIIPLFSDSITSSDLSLPEDVNRVLVTTTLYVVVIVCITLIEFKRYALWAVLLFAAHTVLIVSSSSQASLLFLILFCLALPILSWAPQIGKLLKWVLPVLVLVFPLIVQVIQVESLIALDWPVINAFLSQGSAVHRLEVWSGALEAIKDAPFVGFGFATETALKNMEAPWASYQFAQIRHPHSLPIHVWLNGGIVGATCIAVLIHCALRQVERFPSHIKPFALSVASASFGISCVSHGAWQGWWLAAALIPFGALMSLQRRT